MTHTYGVSNYTIHYDIRLAQDGQESKEPCARKESGTPPLDEER